MEKGALVRGGMAEPVEHLGGHGGRFATLVAFLRQPTTTVFILLVTLMLLAACEARPAPEHETPPPGPDAAPATLEVRDDSPRIAGAPVEVCWSTARAESCTLSVLHASGAGEFDEVDARSGCQTITMESHTLVELFCSGPDGNIHEVLELTNGS